MTADPISAAEARELVAARRWWYHKFEIAPGVITPGVYDISAAFDNLCLPADMTGLEVLELGPSDGAFTKRMWERGAVITAVDYTEDANFDLMQRLSGCTARFVKSNALHLGGLGLGTFDLVLMMGVLYHLPDPFRAIWLARQHLRRDSRFVLETLISLRDGAPLMEYLPADTSNNDATNFWAPNAQCCREMLRDCGLIIDRELLGGTRAIFHTRLNAAAGAGFKAVLGYSA